MVNAPQTIKKHHPSPAPYYITAAALLLWALLLPLFDWWHYLLCAALAVAVFVISRRVFPGTTTVVELKPDDSGLEQEAQTFLKQLAADDEAIADEDVSAHIRALADRTRQIYTVVAQHPEKRGQIRRFSRQYLPMLLKLLDHYAELEHSGLGGENVVRSREEIRRVLTVALDAFARQLDALYQAEALDISTDITVLTALLKQNGLAGEADFDTTP